jgi:hypothetical protein
MSDEDIATGNAGSATTILVEAGSRKIGTLLMMKDEFPCKVTSF